MNIDRESSSREELSIALYKFLADKMSDYRVIRHEYTSGDSDLMELLPGSKRQIMAAIKAGVDPCFAEEHSLLFLTVSTDDIGGAKCLLNHGAAIDSRTIFAADSPQMLKLLVSHGAELDQPDADGHTLLCHAAAERWRLPPDAGPELSTKSYGTFSTDLLLSMGCNPFKASATGLLPIDYAWEGNRNIAELLLQHMNPARKLINQQDIDGTTVLIRAVLANQIDKVKDLLALGADVSTLDARGRSALSISIQSRFGEIETLLMAHGAEYSPAIRIESEPQLMAAARLGYVGNSWSAIQQGIFPSNLNKILEQEHSRLTPIFIKSMISNQPDLAKNWNIELVDSWLELINECERAKALLPIVLDKYPEDSWLNESAWRFENLKYASTCWHLRTVELPTAEADRRMSMLSGPFFTSKDYPWPRQPDGALGSPIVQLDLAPISKLRELPFGNGLLQVFDCGCRNSVIRVIPREEVVSADMTDPCLDPDKYDHSGLGSMCWLQEKTVAQIIGYEGPYFSCSVELERTYSDTPAELIELAKRIKAISATNDAGFHLFGTFYPIGHWASDCPEMLISLDGGYGYEWGDSGNAQVFYSFNEKNEPVFSFDWSCY